MMYVNPIKLNNYYPSKKHISFRENATTKITTSEPISLKNEFHDDFTASLNTSMIKKGHFQSKVSKFGKTLRNLFTTKDFNDPLNLEYSIFKF